MSIDKNTALRALNVRLGPNDPDVDTVRDYLKELLYMVLVEEEGFSGKRPFGNSGWQHEFMEPLRDAGIDCSDERALFEALVHAL
jgi:hypothetical protein